MKRLRLRFNLTSYEIAKRKEKAIISIVWHLPEPIVYWAFIRVATCDSDDGPPTEQTVIEVMEKWRALTKK